MPKATLQFNLPEEHQEHQDAVHGSDWKFVVWDLDQFLRNKLKYDMSDYKDKSPYDVFEEVRSELWDIINTKALSLDL
jgi:hypothetical protein